MYLKSIKISGFKTFVDPTIIVTSGRLVGVVGPNGCGKSNVIDSIRWVLGESRASALRGQSLQDVIFAGSQARRPVSRASVELIFDNSSGRVSGPWGHCAEIAVKRVLSRSGDSVYSINGQVVRRRDVIDTFLGTGVGAYAIIEQGMVSRLIESKPEEVRLFLEEAADVSRYRERRKETETRLLATQENLQRVGDILSELSRTLQSLDEEAAVAYKYQSLVKEQDDLKYQVWGYEKKQGEDEQQKILQSVQWIEKDLALIEEALNQQQSVYTQLKAEQSALSVAVEMAQQVCLEKTQVVLRLESERKYRVEKINDQARQHAVLLEKVAHAEKRLAALDEEHQALLQALLVLADQCEAVDVEQSQCRDQQQEAQIALEKQDAVWRALEVELQQRQQQVALLQTEQKYATNQVHDWSDRLDNARANAAALPTFDDSLLEDLLKQKAHYAELSARLLADVTVQGQLKKEQAAACSILSQEKEEIQKKIVAAQARCDLLCDQQASVTQVFSLADWLADEKMQPLWCCLQVSTGWQKAVEVVLDYRLQAGFLVDLQDLLQKGDARPTKRATVFLDCSPPEKIEANSLLHKIRFVDVRFRSPLFDCLADVLCVDTRADLFVLQKSLECHQIAVTPDGDLATAHMVSICGESEHDGVLVRQSEIEDLQYVMSQQQCLLQSVQQTLDQRREQIVQSEQRLVSLSEKKKETDHLLYEVSVEYAKCKEKSVSCEEQARHYQDLIAESTEKIAVWQSTVANCVVQLSALETDMTACSARQAAAVQTRDWLRRAFFEKKDSFQNVSRKKDALHQKMLADTQKKEQLLRLRKELHDMYLSYQQECVKCSASLVALREENAVFADQDDALVQKIAAEKSLHAAREDHRSCHDRLCSCDTLLAQCRDKKEKTQSLLVKAQLRAQRCALVLSQLIEKKKDYWVDDTPEAQNWFAACVPSVVSAAIQEKQRCIDQLGPVNLGACDKLDNERKRHDFLYQQSQDLLGAIKTLKDAIAQIDEVSRQRLQSTFDRANEQLSRIFPRLFGGGRACFVWLGDDILTAGVDIVACPPGKKNTSIYLLSGGEKALTALSIIFSLFQLNPAPFCLLDEVDAPLDESNTVRLGDLVREMSVATQFIFVTHSKVFMEIAQQLVGVTMQELGISRIVEVGLQDAVGIVEKSEESRQVPSLLT